MVKARTVDSELPGVPLPTDLSTLSKEALQDATRRLEALVSSGGACLDDYGALALCHQEWARRGQSS